MTHRGVTNRSVRHRGVTEIRAMMQRCVPPYVLHIFLSITGDDVTRATPIRFIQYDGYIKAHSHGGVAPIRVEVTVDA